MRESRFFLRDLGRNPQNTVLGYKKGSKIKIINIFEIFGGDLYMQSVVIFRLKAL